MGAGNAWGHHRLEPRAIKIQAVWAARKRAGADGWAGTEARPTMASPQARRLCHQII